MAHVEEYDFWTDAVRQKFENPLRNEWCDLNLIERGLLYVRTLCWEL